MVLPLLSQADRLVDAGTGVTANSLAAHILNFYCLYFPTLLHCRWKEDNRGPGVNA